MNFPDRETEIGKCINAYLKSKSDLNDEAIHLLFSGTFILLNFLKQIDGRNSKKKKTHT
jgi:hypothetical protein